MEFFDCHASYGPTYTRTLLELPDPQALIAQMERVGIGKALVYHGAAVRGYPLEAKQRLITELAPYPQLVPAWVLLPPQTGEWDLESFPGEMKASGVRALWAFPGDHRYLLNKVTMGPVLEELVARKIPLFLKKDWCWLPQATAPGVETAIFAPCLSSIPTFTSILQTMNWIGALRLYVLNMVMSGFFSAPLLQIAPWEVHC